MSDVLLQLPRLPPCDPLLSDVQEASLQPRSLHATCHATCLVVAETGILIRGDSGLGKSRLAQDLINVSTQQKRFSRLVSDDRVNIEVHHGRLIARRVDRIAGLLEVRGLGILQVHSEAACKIGLVVDLVADMPPRFAEPQDETVVIKGVCLKRIFLYQQPHRPIDPFVILNWCVC